MGNDWSGIGKYQTTKLVGVSNGGTHLFTQKKIMPWVKLSKAIDHTGVKSRKTLIRWAQNGEIVGSKGPGGQWFFDLESIDRRLTPTTRQKAVDIVRSLQL
jgi:hypothetical protein